MAIDFPDNPSVNDTFTAGGKVYQWDGTVWEIYGPNVSPGTFKIDDVNNRVGINNASPSQNLDVIGNTQLRDVFIDSVANWNYGQLRISRNASNTANTKIVSVLLDGDSPDDTDLYSNANVLLRTDSAPTSGSTSAALNAGIEITAPDSVRFGTNGGEKMRIDSSGNVGINTTPSYWLDVRDNDLGQTLGDSSDHLRLSSPVVGNTSMLYASNKRFANGTGWQNTSWRIQHKVDNTDMAFVEFNPDGAERGISFGTDNVEHVVIDSNGRMAAASQPYFYAYLSSNISFDSNTQNTTVPYNTTSANVGNCYNTSNGLFTAPVSGRYVFTGGIYSNTASVSISQLWFVRNGGRVGTFCLDGGSGPNRQGTGYIYLEANDTVGVHPWADGAGTINIVASTFHTYWSGSLLV